MSRATVKVVRIHYRHPGLEVDALKGVGWRAIQGEEWKGSVRSSYRAALQDARDRNAQAQTA
jgi:hypothetical protein